MNKLVLTVVSLLMAWPQAASALCTLTCSCSVSTTSVAFGTYNPLLPVSSDTAGNVRVTCSGTLGLLVPYDVALSSGSHGAGFGSRKMASGPQQLSYNLYTDSARSVVWGDGTGGSQIVSDSITIVLIGGSSKNHTVYGRIPGSQTTVSPGSYADLLTVTVTYY